MPREQKKVIASDILPLAEYEQKRKALRHAMVEMKHVRRIGVGPFATFYFENYDTMQAQIQEMLYIEKGGAAQLADELAAYNPLIPQGAELTATLMLEIADEEKRPDILRTLTDIELKAFIEVSADDLCEKSYARPEQDVERTAADGKTSSVHFLHFAFSAEAISAFKNTAGRVTLGIEHENYPHITILSPASRHALACDFD